MRALIFGVLLLSVAAFGATTSPFFQLEQTKKEGKVHVVGKNTSRIPLVAYVVIAERGSTRIVWHGNYNGGDALGIQKTVDVGEVAEGWDAAPMRVSVDYVRFADGTAWGDATTDEAKGITASYQK